MEITHIKPDRLLLPFVSRYWSWQGEGVLPGAPSGTGAESMPHFNGASVSTRQSQEYVSLPLYSMLLLPRRCQFELDTSSFVDFISVRFRAGALRHFCAIPIIELVDLNSLTAKEIWGEAGFELEMRLLEADSFLTRIEIIEYFLLQQLCIHQKKQQIWFDHIIGQLYYDAQNEEGLRSVIQQAGISHRYFQKVFKLNTGVSPKHFQCITRFEHTLRTLMLTQSKDYLPLALENGYYDQSHFIKDFKRFTCQTPLSFLQEENFRTHFYNPPLSS